MEGGALDYGAGTPVESWQDQADRYAATLSVAHPDATARQITGQSTDGLEVSFFRPSGQRVARLWFVAHKGGWRLETTQECSGPPPGAASGQ